MRRCPPRPPACGSACEKSASVSHTRARALAHWLPEGAPAERLVEAAARGALTLGLLVGVCGGGGGAASDERRLFSLLRLWPVLVEVVVDCTPRDADVRDALLRLSRRAFALEPKAALRLVERVLAEYTKKFVQYLGGVEAAPPAWRAALATVLAECVEQHAVSSLGAAAAPGSPPVSDALKAAKRALGSAQGALSGHKRKLKDCEAAAAAAPADVAARKALADAKARLVELEAAVVAAREARDAAQ